MTDMFGGSVNNELMELIRRKNTHLVTGVNLALVIGILTGDEEEPAKGLISRMVEEARAAMLYCNEMDLEEADPMDEF